MRPSACHADFLLTLSVRNWNIHCPAQIGFIQIQIFAMRARRH